MPDGGCLIKPLLFFFFSYLPPTYIFFSLLINNLLINVTPVCNSKLTFSVLLCPEIVAQHAENVILDTDILTLICFHLTTKEIYSKC